MNRIALRPADQSTPREGDRRSSVVTPGPRSATHVDGSHAMMADHEYETTTKKWQRPLVSADPTICGQVELPWCRAPLGLDRLSLRSSPFGARGKVDFTLLPLWSFLERLLSVFSLPSVDFTLSPLWGSSVSFQSLVSLRSTSPSRPFGARASPFSRPKADLRRLSLKLDQVLGVTD